ncbi:uncharacterized protein LOC119385674 [Rhipicephalus sanguineus]|uniref:uncharacterized protein LOC119385674 n=1 Tax=Rhipicephalus sanguineus TaxID=34632 RepID=UPI0018935366|nr:uncharacterized protein LOC119385674 [Rhipicephalus sanguineus]
MAEETTPRRYLTMSGGSCQVIEVNDKPSVVVQIPAHMLVWLTEKDETERPLFTTSCDNSDVTVQSETNAAAGKESVGIDKWTWKRPLDQQENLACHHMPPSTLHRCSECGVGITDIKDYKKHAAGHKRARTSLVHLWRCFACM